MMQLNLTNNPLNNSRLCNLCICVKQQPCRVFNQLLICRWIGYWFVYAILLAKQMQMKVGHELMCPLSYVFKSRARRQQLTSGFSI